MMPHAAIQVCLNVSLPLVLFVSNQEINVANIRQRHAYLLGFIAEERELPEQPYPEREESGDGEPGEQKQTPFTEEKESRDQDDQPEPASDTTQDREPTRRRE